MSIEDMIETLADSVDIIADILCQKANMFSLNQIYKLEDVSYYANCIKDELVKLKGGAE
jgi:hypothetical protein